MTGWIGSCCTNQAGLKLTTLLSDPLGRIPPHQVGKVEFRLAEKGLDTLVEGLGFSMIQNAMGLPNSPAQPNTGRTITVPPNTCKAYHIATELPGRAEIQGNRLLDRSYSRRTSFIIHRVSCESEQGQSIQSYEDHRQTCKPSPEILNLSKTPTCFPYSPFIDGVRKLAGCCGRDR